MSIDDETLARLRIERVDVLAVLDETIRKTEAAMPTPLNMHGESREHPVHHASRLHELKQARAVMAELIGAADDLPRCSYCEADSEWQRLSGALDRIVPYTGGE